MTGIGSVPPGTSTIAQAASNGTGWVRPVLVAAGALALGGLAIAAWRSLQGDGGSDATRGSDELGSAPPAATPPISSSPPPATPPVPREAAEVDGPPAAVPPEAVEEPTPIVTTPGAGYLALTKTGPRAAEAATDPAAFRELLAADGPGWAAADGTISIPLPDGKTLWLFGDTLMHLPNADGSLRRNADFVRNSAILMDGTTATTLTTGTSQDAGDFLAPADPNEWYWPGHGIVEGDELVVFMGRVRATADGAPGWNFEGVGSDMVRLDLRDLSVKERVQMPAVTGVDWGTAVLPGGDGYTYVWGFKGYEDDPFRREAVLARAKEGHLKEGAFEYWDGAGWSGDASKAAAVADGVSNSFSVVRTPQGKFAMVSQELFFGTKLQVRTADSPQGPWSEWRTIDEGPEKGPGGISYNAQVHPTFTADGKLLASWNMNRDDGRLPGPDELDGYRPVFRAVDAAALDGG